MLVQWPSEVNIFVASLKKSAKALGDAAKETAAKMGDTAKEKLEVAHEKLKKKNVFKVIN